ncbi:LacI family DNA-binding transcriptional regulator [Halobacillus amylolyticus]|uniref:LacI family DNA-binding transcriptional regulator n=1 Tax=Halobacillus amylolyticus TaxID=2932259 RepID=A0ABY4H809_9BACI|nr:LacI family DNA-binding transcriptional regulator [Halobacillus amylolyticus]UOR11003.1 LacI family DNA-binding transcriptional regulator [Halobacillus amylolyticus]
MAVTIKDVAKLANVAPSTVSRVIANNPRISEATKKRVKEAMKELGYHPNFSARSLANQNTQAIGIVMPSSGNSVFQNPFFPEVIRGISAKAHENKYALYMTTGTSEQEMYDGVVDMIQGRRVDGIVLLYSRVDDRIMTYLQESNFPFVVIGKPFRNIEDITHIDNDNFRAAQDATEHLIQQQHDRIGFVGGDRGLVVTVDRLLGYEKAIQKAGLTYRDDYVVHEEFLEEGGQEAINELMSLEEPPTGLVVTDDLMALGILKTLSEMDIKVPDDISVISFNNVMLSEISTPSLTSVCINIFWLGYEAADSLIEKIKVPETKPKRVTVPYRLVERNSCQTRQTN